MRESAPPHFHLAVWEFLSMLQEQWIGRGGPTAWPALSPDLNILLFISGDIWSLLFLLQKSVTSRTCFYEYKMDLTWLVWHLEFFSQSGSHCSNVQCLALKTDVDTSNISFNEAVLRNPCLRRPMFIVDFFPCTFVSSKRCGWRMEKISLINRLRNEEVLQRVKEERNILQIIKRKRLTGFVICCAGIAF